MLLGFICLDDVRDGLTDDAVPVGMAEDNQEEEVREKAENGRPKHHRTINSRITMWGWPEDLDEPLDSLPPEHEHHDPNNEHT